MLAVLCVSWLLVAILFGVTITYAYKLKNFFKAGIVFIVSSYAAGLTLLFYAVTLI
jgi:hypothetical protein